MTRLRHLNKAKAVWLNQQIARSRGDEILELFAHRGFEFSAVNLSTALHRLARSG